MKVFRHTLMISFAFSVDRALSTRSTACAVVWFWNLSKMVAAVKSLTKNEKLCTAGWGRLTPESLLEFVQSFQSHRTSVERLYVFRVESKGLIAVFHNELVVGRDHVDITCVRMMSETKYRNATKRRTGCAVTEEYRLCLWCHFDRLCVVLGCKCEVASGVCCIALCLEC